MREALKESVRQPETKAKSVIVGTAGHIDHGKTALVFALTGTDTDRLPEEKQRGITIDLGFAALRLPDGKGGNLEISMVDVPGHHAFIRNMLAGTGGIDCVMLVVAADEGVKAQTAEHLAICTLLGIKHGIVALTKSDLVSAEQLCQTREKVSQFVQRSFLQGAPILPVSAATGGGISGLKSALTQLASEIPARSADSIPRLPLDRAFTIRGFGTVVTGTLQSGVLRSGDVLEQHPAGRMLRVRGLQVHGESREAAHAPCRVALNLSGVEVAQIARGDMLAPPHTLSSQRTIDVEVRLLPGANGIQHGARVRVHAFAGDSLASVLLFEGKHVNPSDSALARLRLTRPMLLLPDDRFVLRQSSPAMTIGGGVVLDSRPQPGTRKAAALQWLTALKSADECEQVRLRVLRRAVEGISLDYLVAETGSTPEKLRKLLGPLIISGRLIDAKSVHPHTEHWIAAEALSGAIDRVQDELGRAGVSSISRAELRSKTKLNQPVFELAMQRLTAANKVEIESDKVRIAGRADDLTPVKRSRLRAIETMYVEAGLAAPLLSEVSNLLKIAPSETRELITLLLRSKRLVRMGSDDAFVHPQFLDKLYSDLRKHQGESFDVGRFKAFTGLTRKHAIPLLEHLDKLRVTRNNGGTRVVL